LSPACSGRPTRPRRSRRSQRSWFPHIHFDELVAAYGEALAGLADGGADLILLETIFDTLNAKAAVFGSKTLFEQRGHGFRHRVRHTSPTSPGAPHWARLRKPSGIRLPRAAYPVGLNCALGAKLMRPYIEELSNVADTFISCYRRGAAQSALGKPDTTKRRN